MQWLRQKTFSFVHGNQLIYNTCWEDPKIDRIALRLGQNDRLVTITSAGCNALDYALEAPAHVHAIDVNPRQNALLELKLAGIRSLDFDTFFSIFGDGRNTHFGEIYRRDLRPCLSESARGFWDHRQHFFSGEGRRPSFYFYGTTGVVAWLMNLYLDQILNAHNLVDAILDAPSVEEQRRIYDQELAARMWKGPLRWMLRRDTVLSMLGVPRPQRDQIDRDWPGGISKFIEDCVYAVFGELSLRDNYFWRVYLTGKYSPRCCPEYLKPENFQKLQNGLVDRISVHTSSVAGFLENCPHPVTRFVLLDHMDWLAHHEAPALRREWQAIVDRAAPNSRVLWRSAGTRTDFVDQVEVKVKASYRRVGDLLGYHRETADRLHRLDRVHTYGSFHFADLCLS